MSYEISPSDHAPAVAGSLSAPAAAWSFVPGLLLTAIIAAFAFALRQIPAISLLSPMMIAVVLSMVVQNSAGVPEAARAGIAIAARPLLRVAIVLLGLQLTGNQLLELGLAGVGVIIVTVAATFVVTVRLGKVLGVERGLSELIAAGTSICGASAIIATNTVTAAREEDVAYAVACVTLFGSIAMFAYPLLPGLLELDARAYGLWTGATVHEIGQVAAAAFQFGDAAGEAGTVAKLSRVVLLAPMLLALAALAVRRRKGSDGASPKAKVPVPWFIFGFLLMIALNSLVTIPDLLKQSSAQLSVFLMSMALAAMGLQIDARKLTAKGVRPLLLSLASFLFIASLGLVLTKMSTM